MNAKVIVKLWKLAKVYKMAHDVDAAAELLARQMQAFTLTVIEKRSLRDAAAIMGVSHTTVKAYALSYKKALASERVAENVEERRAAFDAELEMLKSKSLEVYDYCMKAGKRDEDGKIIKMPLAAVGALNSYTATLAHQRAVQGLDTPKQAEVKEDITYNVKWDDSPD